VPEQSAFEFKMAIGKLKTCKSPFIDSVPAEGNKAGVGHFIMWSINL
jgi:hypothetical protein